MAVEDLMKNDFTKTGVDALLFKSLPISEEDFSSSGDNKQACGEKTHEGPSVFQKPWERALEVVKKTRD
ncbi:MAG: hypothetical protein VR65_04470 [Desulfobulbaceae bacterium BRH_c16a]|nr:MAG: hypothetical protein VR65_04470 [Desulfobulbaceae bacterium BRH_c16a]